jgi:hypothetical protein
MRARANQFRHPNGGVLPLFARKYRLHTVPKKNAIGRWWGIKFDPLDYVTRPEYDAAKALYDFVRQGRLRVDPSSIDPE